MPFRAAAVKMVDNCSRLLADDWIHLPCNGGVRLRPNDYRLHEVGPRAVDLAVIESLEGDRFVPVQWEGRLELVQNDDRSITFPGPALDGCDGFPDLESSIAAYRIRYPIPARSSKPEATSFARVMTVDLWLPEGVVAHNYADTASMIDELAHRGLARGTLIYLLGWNAPYDSGYPRYQYADALGGEKGFSRLVEVCRKHGVEIMLHLNFWGYDPVTELLPDYEKLRVLNAHGTAEDWSGRLRSGFTNSLSYIRVDDTRWNDLFFSQVDPFIERWEIGAVFLDHLGWSTDPQIDSAGLAMVDRLHEHHPGLAVGGEVLCDRYVPFLDLFQVWGPPWSGQMVDYTDSFSPIVRLLYGGSVPLISHLGLPCAVASRYCWTHYPFLLEKGCEAAFLLAQEHRRKIGGLPHVRSSFGDKTLDSLSLAILAETDG